MYTGTVQRQANVRLRPPILKFSFQNPLSCNRKRHHTLCSNSTEGYILGVSSDLATAMKGSSDPKGLCPGVYVRQSTNWLSRSVCYKTFLSSQSYESRLDERGSPEYFTWVLPKDLRINSVYIFFIIFGSALHDYFLLTHNSKAARYSYMMVNLYACKHAWKFRPLTHACAL